MCSRDGSKALCLRLAALLIEIGSGAERDAYTEVLLSESNFHSFSPFVLLVFAREAVVRDSADRVQQAVDYFLEHFETSALAPDIISVQIRALLAAEKYSEALFLCSYR